MYGFTVLASSSPYPLADEWQPSCQEGDEHFDPDGYCYHYLHLEVNRTGPSRIIIQSPTEVAAQRGELRYDPEETRLGMDILQECREVIESRQGRAQFSLEHQITVPLSRMIVQRLHDLSLCTEDGMMSLPVEVDSELNKNGWYIHLFAADDLGTPMLPQAPLAPPRRRWWNFGKEATQAVQAVLHAYDGKNWYLLLRQRGSARL